MIRENIQRVQERIRRSCQRAQRSPSEVTLVLVSKNRSEDLVREAYEAGVRDFGENRVQELLAKKTALPDDLRWHFQGRLQTNKVKSLWGEIVLLHSLDRLELAEEIQKQGEKKNLGLDALVQVNTSGEETKAGFKPEEVEKSVAELKKFSHIHLKGFMTIGPFLSVGAGFKPAPTNEGNVRTCFRKLRILCDELRQKFPELDLRHLSMGMSSDFEWAVEEGATIVRIGTAVFGERPVRHCEEGQRPDEAISKGLLRPPSAGSQ